jgi:hypothetical protein
MFIFPTKEFSSALFIFMKYALISRRDEQLNIATPALQYLKYQHGGRTMYWARRRTITHTHTHTQFYSYIVYAGTRPY